MMQANFKAASSDHGKRLLEFLSCAVGQNASAKGQLFGENFMEDFRWRSLHAERLEVSLTATK